MTISPLPDGVKDPLLSVAETAVLDATLSSGFVAIPEYSFIVINWHVEDVLLAWIVSEPEPVTAACQMLTSPRPPARLFVVVAMSLTIVPSVAVPALFVTTTDPVPPHATAVTIIVSPAVTFAGKAIDPLAPVQVLIPVF